MSYHLQAIPKGQYGELSKIREEVEEAIDAEKQNNPIMVLVELSDIIGAIDGYIVKKYDGKINLADLIVMSMATSRAFRSGERE
jgi:hypothetical protein